MSDYSIITPASLESVSIDANTILVAGTGKLTIATLKAYIEGLVHQTYGNTALTASGIYIANEDAVGNAKWHKLRVKTIHGVPTLFADETGVSL